MTTNPSQIGLRRSLQNFSRLVILALIALVATALLSVQILRIEGPLYSRIVLGKDLIADVLPPPEYVLEAYLEATLAVQNPRQLETRAERLRTLEAEYRARHDFWSTAALPKDLREHILVRSHEPAQRFWVEIDERLLPALRAGDEAAASASYARLTGDYAVHRAAIDQLVKAANQSNARTESLAMAALLGFVGLVVVVAAGLIVLVQRRSMRIARGVVDPMADLTASMSQLSVGGAVIDIPHADRTDEVGEMARALSVFRTQAADAARMRDERLEAQRSQEEERQRAAAEQDDVVAVLAAGLAQLASGDLTIRIETAFPSQYDRLREDFNRTAAQLDSVLGQVRRNSDGIQVRVAQIARANEDLTQRTQAQANNVEDTGRTLQGIAEAVRASARATAQASDAVLDAKAEAEHSGGVIAQTVSAMNEIVASSREITQVVEVIDEISFQTNLLALNAGVEAARAGEFGRGFAVVATEVRALAQHSAERAKDINALIQTSTSQVDTGMRFVTDTGETLRRIVEQVGDLANFVGKIAESTQEQAGRLGAVNVASDQLEEATQQNARMAEECSQAVRELCDQANVLAQMVGRFRLSAGADDDDVAQTVVREVAPTRPQLRARVLIVDDNAINRTVAATVCEMFGCSSEQAEDGEAGLRAAQRGGFDVILMDIMMPGMGGVEAIRRIRRLPGPPGMTPIIAVTANGLERTVAEIQSAGVAAVIEKPLSPEALFEAIQAVLARRSSSGPVAIAGRG